MNLVRVIAASSSALSCKKEMTGKCGTMYYVNIFNIQDGAKNLTEAITNEKNKIKKNGII